MSSHALQSSKPIRSNSINTPQPIYSIKNTTEQTRQKNNKPNLSSIPGTGWTQQRAQQPLQESWGWRGIYRSWGRASGRRQQGSPGRSPPSSRGTSPPRPGLPCSAPPLPQRGGEQRWPPPPHLHGGTGQQGSRRHPGKHPGRRSRHL